PASVLKRIFLRNNLFTNHTTGFPDIQLMWPVSIVYEFIFCQSPLPHSESHVLWYFGIVCQKIHQTFLIILVCLDNFCPLFIRSFRIIVIHSDIVCTERTMVVCICLSIWDRIKFLKSLPPSGCKHTCQQFVFFGIVIIWLRKSNPIVRMIAETHPETISLKTLISLPIFARMIR